MRLRMSASASLEALNLNGRIALSSDVAAPEAAGDGLCAEASEATPNAAMIMGSVIFMTAFLVEVLPLKRRDLLPCCTLRSLFDECSDILRTRYVDGVAAFNLDNCCAGAFRHHSLGVRRNHFVLSGEQVPAWFCFPCRFTDFAVECLRAPRNLRISHESGRIWFHVSGE